MLTEDQMVHHPTSEQLVQILCSKTQSENPLFFRVLVGYYFSMIASMMRISITTHDRGNIPVNMYAINLSPSGTGKGFSTNIIENHVINGFRTSFLEETFPLLVEQNLPKLAIKRAARKGLDPDEELVKVQREFDALGPLVFGFDSGTPAAIKQMRHKLLMADAGSMNLQIDEIGSNLVGNIDVLDTFIELYDVGTIKNKLIKNTAENLRNEEILGRTPTNMLLFGTPSKLLNGAKPEEEFYAMLETGYARRCFFGYTRSMQKAVALTPTEVYDMLTNTTNNAYLDSLCTRLQNLANMVNINRSLTISKDTTLLLIEYKLQCERESEKFAEHEDVKKAEISHRYFKALKLAGAYAFIDNSPEVTEAHLYNAIKLAEESGEAFNRLLTRDRPYVKLAKYIASCLRDVTQADLVEDLPFYRGSTSQKSEMMSLAIAYGYKNNIIIKKSIADSIEFFRGESLKETDLSNMVVSYSKELAHKYLNEKISFDQLPELFTANDYHWVNHHVVDGHRAEEDCIPGFNLVVIDVDKGASLSMAMELLKDYKYIIYTTKRHTDSNERFRIILPTNFELKLDAKDFKEFMHNVHEWLPFEADSAAGQRARKWMSHDGTVHINDGALFDVLPFIPKTSKNEERKQLLDSQVSMDNLERWVINNIGDGNRNNMLLRYAMILTDAGFTFDGVTLKVKELNNKLVDKLEESEIVGTILVSVMKAMQNKGG